MRIALAVALALSFATLSFSGRALAQRTLAQDTMSMASPVAVECGFCAMEAYGVVFQRVGASGGLLPSDFPLTVQNVQLALGAAQVTAGACHGIAVPASPDTLVHFELWAGTTIPDVADIHAMPVAGMPWPGEDLVISLDDVPVTMSVPTTDGAANFNLMLNTLMLGDAMTPVPTVDATHTYLRAVVVLADGGMSSTCSPSTNAPTGFPLRDDDGVVANHRSFIYAQGMGWLWNEVVGVHGDWGIRLTIEPQPHTDAGAVDAGATSDAGTTSDAASAIDGGVGHDAGTVPAGGSSSCSCRVGARGPGGAAALSLACMALLLGVARRHARVHRRCA